MRATKGLWAALGAGVSLAAAALIVLATMSVVLAVGGWPKGHTAPREGAVALQAVRVAHAAGPAVGQGAGATAPRARRAPEARRGVARQVASRRLTRRPSSSVRPATVSVPGASAPATSHSGASQPGAGGGTAATAPVTKATGTVGTTVTNVTGTAGQVLDPVSRPVGDTVTAVGQQAGQAVDQVGQAVGGVLGGLTGGSK